MKCVIPGANVKILAKAIHALAKIGEELYIQPQKDCLSFRTVNIGNSAYSDFTFFENYFSYYTLGDLEEDDALKCKISMRSAMTVFKSPNTLDKQVETCHIKLQPGASNILFILKYKTSIIKTHLLPIIDCEKLQAVYIKDGVPNQLLSQPRLFSDAMQNFQQNLVEITVEVTQQKMLLRNYIDDTSGMSNITRTQLALSIGEFDRYTVNAETVITFCMKELKAILLFADTVGIPLGTYFEAPGRPVVFILKNPTFEVNLVLSTLNPDVDNQSESTVVHFQEQSTRKRGASKKNTSKRATTVRGKNRPINSIRTTCKSIKTLTHPAPAERGVNHNVSNVHDNHTLLIPNNETNISRINENKIICEDNLKETSNQKNLRTDLSSPSTSGAISKTMTYTDRNLIHTVFSAITKRKSNADAKEESHNEQNRTELNDSVPNSPPRPVKKARIIFKKCFQTTFNPRMLPGYDTVLVEDSDECDSN